MSMAKSEASQKESASAADAGMTILLLDSPGNEGVDFLQNMQRMGMKFISERVNNKDSLFNALKKSHWDILIVNDKVTAPSVEETLNYLTQIKNETVYLLLSSVEISIDLLTAHYKKGISAVVSSLNLDYSFEVFVRAAERSRRYVQHSQLNEKKFDLVKHRDQLKSSTVEAVAYLSDGIHVFCNDAYLKILGYTDMDHLITMPFIDIVSIEMREKVKKMILDFQHAVEVMPDMEPMSIPQLNVEAAGEKKGIIDVTAIFNSASFDGKDCIQVLFKDNLIQEECDKILGSLVCSLREIMKRSEVDKNYLIGVCEQVATFASIPNFMRKLEVTYLAILADEILFFLSDIFDQDTLDWKKIKARASISYDAIINFSVLINTVREYQDSFAFISSFINKLRVYRGKAAVFNGLLLAQKQKIKFHQHYSRAPHKMEKLLSKQAFYLEKAGKILLLNPKDEKAYLALVKIISNMEKIFIECRFGTLWGLARGVLDTTNHHNYLDAERIGAVVALAKPLYLISKGDLTQLQFFEYRILSRIVNILNESKKNTLRLSLIRQWLLVDSEMDGQFQDGLKGIDLNTEYGEISELSTSQDGCKNSYEIKNYEKSDLNQKFPVSISESKASSLDESFDPLISKLPLQPKDTDLCKILKKDADMQLIGKELEKNNTLLISIIDGSNESLLISELQNPLNRLSAISSKYLQEEYIDTVRTICRFIQNNSDKTISADIAAALQTFCLLTSRLALHLIKGAVHSNIDFSIEILDLKKEFSELDKISFKPEMTSTPVVFGIANDVSIKSLISSINSVTQIQNDAEDAEYGNVIKNLQILSALAETYGIDDIVKLASCMETAYHFQGLDKSPTSISINELLLEAHVWLSDMAKQLEINKVDITSSQELCNRLMSATTSITIN
jgi:PAS domain-containing protein